MHRALTRLVWLNLPLMWAGYLGKIHKHRLLASSCPTDLLIAATCTLLRMHLSVPHPHLNGCSSTEQADWNMGWIICLYVAYHSKQEDTFRIATEGYSTLGRFDAVLRLVDVLSASK